MDRLVAVRWPLVGNHARIASLARTPTDILQNETEAHIHDDRAILHTVHWHIHRVVRAVLRAHIHLQYTQNIHTCAMGRLCSTTTTPTLHRYQFWKLCTPAPTTHRHTVQAVYDSESAVGLLRRSSWRSSYWAIVLRQTNRGCASRRVSDAQYIEQVSGSGDKNELDVKRQRRMTNTVLIKLDNFILIKSSAVPSLHSCCSFCRRPRSA